MILLSLELNSHPSDHVKDSHGISPEKNETKKNVITPDNENHNKTSLNTKNIMNTHEKSENLLKGNVLEEEENQSKRDNVDPKQNQIKPGPKLKCPICTLFFWSDNSLNYHIAEVHEKEHFNTSLKNKETTKNIEIPENHEIFPSCSICNEQFSNIKTLRNHLPNCSKKQAILDDEPEIITGDLSDDISFAEKVFDFKCSKCPMAFRSQTLLSTHMHKHSAEIIFKCSKCPTTFKTQTLLRSHVFQHHENEVIVKCSNCFATFKSENERKIHFEKEHSKEATKSETIADKTSDTKSIGKPTLSFKISPLH